MKNGHIVAIVGVLLIAGLFVVSNSSPDSSNVGAAFFSQKISISNVQVSGVTSSLAYITFSTNLPAWGKVCYSTNPIPTGSCVSDGGGYDSSHRIKIENLKANTKYYYQVHANTATVQTASNISSFTTLPVASRDTTSPSVSISVPVSGAMVSGVTTISASASDNMTVTKVQFMVDGVVVGNATAAPYTVAWSTYSFANTSHTIIATAWDAAGNTGVSAPVSVGVKNNFSTSTSATSTR